MGPKYGRQINPDATLANSGTAIQDSYRELEALAELHRPPKRGR